MKSIKLVTLEDGSRVVFAGDTLTYTGTWHDLPGHTPNEIAAIRRAQAPVPLSEASLALLQETSPAQLEAMTRALDLGRSNCFRGC